MTISAVAQNLTCRTISGHIIFYTFASRFRLLNHSTLRMQIFASALSNLVQIIQFKLGYLYAKNKLDKWAFTLIPFILNGLPYSRSSLKIDILRSLFLGGMQTLLMHYERRQFIEALILKVGKVFSSSPQISNIYGPLLRSSLNLNAQHDGWTILHYCIYAFSFHMHVLKGTELLSLPNSKGKEILELISLLVRNGANLKACDKFGRTPLYFASTIRPEHSQQNLSASEKELKEQFRKLVSTYLGSLSCSNKDVYPLHVVSSLGKYVDDLIEMGANPTALDRHQRMPLHCATIHGYWDSDDYNVQALVYYAPLSLEHSDRFGNCPLFYAYIYGSEELFDFLLDKSSIGTIEKVLKSISNLPQNPDETYFINDPIYGAPNALRIQLGGRKKNQQNNKKAEKLAQKREEKKTTYKGYPTFHDGHGWKHVINQNAYDSAYSKQRDFIKDTEHPFDAMFLPEFFAEANYEARVAACMKFWIDKGADENHKFVEFGKAVGADNGKLTKIVEVYYTQEIGAHIRPKYLERGQS